MPEAGGPAAAPPILAATGLVRRYRLGGGFGRVGAPGRTLQALAGVDLSVPRGGVVGLVGESGSGKSTLSRLLLGLEQPDAGEVRLDGAPLSAIGRRAVARRVQPVFQDPFGSLNPSWRIADIIGLPLAVHRIGSAAERRARVAELLDQVGLPTRVAGSFPHELSGGQRQRVAIARALAIRPDLLICDEPTSALDVSVQAQILNLIDALRRETGVAILLISHDLAVVEHMADEVVVLYLGHVVERGPTAEVFARPRHPYTRALRRAVLTPDASAGLPEVGLKGGFPNPLDPPAGCPFHPRCPHAIDACRAAVPAFDRPGGHAAACLRSDEI